MSDKDIFELYDCAENTGNEMNKLSCLVDTIGNAYIHKSDISKGWTIYCHEKLTILWSLLYDQIDRLEDLIKKNRQLLDEVKEKREKETTEKAKKG